MDKMVWAPVGDDEKPGRVRKVWLDDKGAYFVGVELLQDHANATSTAFPCLPHRERRRVAVLDPVAELAGPVCVTAARAAAACRAAAVASRKVRPTATRLHSLKDGRPLNGPSANS